MANDEAVGKPFDWSTYSTHADEVWVKAVRLTEQFESQAPDERSSTALSVMLFAAVTIEAFLNDLAYVAAGYSDPAASALADVLDEIEANHGSVHLRLLMTGAALGKPFDKGREPYQSFRLLFRLRNEVVHLKPKVFHLLEEDGVEPKDLVHELRRRGLVDEGHFLLDLITTKALCCWAVDTARRVVEHVVGLLPPNLKNQVVAEVVPAMLEYEEPDLE